MHLKHILLGLTFAVFSTVPAFADDAPERAFNVKTSEAGVKYITGGVANDEQALMERRFGEYSFKLVNVRNDGLGAYVSGVDATINNKAGTAVLQATTDGPWLIADLAPGNYEVVASFHGQTQSRELNIAENQRERAVMLWETGDANDNGAAEHPGKKTSEHPGS